MKRSLKVALVVSVASLAGAGIAAALWSAAGTGVGEAKARTAQTVTVSAATATADLYPGFNAGDVSFTLTNPNPYPVTFTNMSAGVVTSSNPGGCPSTNVSVASAAGLTLAVAAGATTATVSIVDVVSMLAGAPDGCQGVTFSIALTLAGAQT